jgi:hypothetical protein
MTKPTDTLRAQYRALIERLDKQCSDPADALSVMSLAVSFYLDQFDVVRRRRMLDEFISQLREDPKTH